MVVLRAVISMHNICKSFGGSPVLRDLSLEVPDGQICGVYGRSGIGKSTLAKILCGIYRPDKGEAFLDGKPLFSGKSGYDRKTGSRIQMVYQQPYATLDPQQKIGKGFAELIRYHRFAPQGGEAEMTREYLAKVGLSSEILFHLPHQISGGEAQRIAIARCLMFRPRLLILDEATSMLDMSTQANVLGLVRRLMSEAGGSILFISHDSALVRLFCGRIYKFEDFA